jgi:hypothetical protein
MSVSRLGCVYQLPSNGLDERAAGVEIELAHLVRAPEVQVHGAVVHVFGARLVSTVPSSSPLEMSTTVMLSGDADRSDTRAAG